MRKTSIGTNFITTVGRLCSSDLYQTNRRLINFNNLPIRTFTHLRNLGNNKVVIK